MMLKTTQPEIRPFHPAKTGSRRLKSACATAFALAVGVLIPLASAAQAAPCTRLPLSDVAFGQEAATEAARAKLAEYAQDVAKKRGWPKGATLAKSNETVSCEVYLNLGPLGTEYQCLVTATFCAK